MRSFLDKIFGRGGEVGCDEVQRLSSDYLEEELPAAKQSAIQFHLNKRGPCKAFVETLASTHRLAIPLAENRSATRIQAGDYRKDLCGQR